MWQISLVSQACIVGILDMIHQVGLFLNCFSNRKSSWIHFHLHSLGILSTGLYRVCMNLRTFKITLRVNT
jgi:hypothetical protein